MLHRNAVAGQLVTLDAVGTREPDGDAIEYRWRQYVEAGSYLQATGRGEPPPTSYQRVIVTVSR